MLAEWMRGIINGSISDALVGQMCNRVLRFLFYKWIVVSIRESSGLEALIASKREKKLLKRGNLLLTN